MSGAEQFTAAVPERSDPRDWRGGLERSGARRGAGRAPAMGRWSLNRVTASTLRTQKS